MEQSALVIRSRGLRGYGAAIMMGLTAVWALIAAFAFQVSARPAAFLVWLLLIIICAIGAVVLEVVFRMDYVKLADGRLSWRYRRGGHGDQPLSAVRGVERMGSSARINFNEGRPLLIWVVWFRPSDIDELVGAVGRLGPATQPG